MAYFNPNGMWMDLNLILQIKQLIIQEKIEWSNNLRNGGVTWSSKLFDFTSLDFFLHYVKCQVCKNNPQSITELKI